MIHYLTRLQEQMATNWLRPALCDYEGETFTYKDLAYNIARFHVLFHSIGIKKGDRIAICARNQARWGVAFLAANTYESVVVPILADFTPDNIESLLKHSGSLILFTDKDIASKLNMNNIPELQLMLNMSDFGKIWARGEKDTFYNNWNDAFWAKYPSGVSITNVNYPTDNEKDIAVINYTSGTTGDPKGVMLRYECFSANTEYGQNTEPSSYKDKLLSVLPMAHIFGMAFEMIYPLCGGTPIYFLTKVPSPTILMRALEEIKPYHFTAVPVVYEKIYNSKIKPVLNKPAIKFLTAIPGVNQIIYRKIRKSFDAAFGGNIQVYIMGGAAMNPDLEDFFRKIGLHFTVGYGMTEAAPLIAYSKWDTFALRSCGRAMSFVKVRVNSEDPEKIPGEIQAKGINLFSGYYKNEAATKAAFTEDGWFNTGDMGIIDKQGNIYLKGRCKTMLLSSNGQNIYPEEIESKLNSEDIITESLVVMKEDRLVALVRLEQDIINKNHLNLDEINRLISTIKANINVKLPKYSQISKIVVMEKPFEKTPKMAIKRYLYN